jgi:hypothetical protein
MEVLDDNEVNYLVLTDDGSTVTKTKSSNLNQLLFDHNLYGLLEEGSEIWTCSNPETAEPTVTIIPDDDAECYTVRVGNTIDLTLGAHHKTDLVDALAEVYQDHDGDSVVPLLDLIESIREDMVRVEALKPFLGILSEKVEERDDGWFINGHLLLTYEGDFHHPATESRERSGQSVIGVGSNVGAYSLNIDPPTSEIRREVEYDGETFRLTDSEVDFIARTLWAIENTPDRRDD